MGGPCRGDCSLGRTRDGRTFIAKKNGGRPPADPATGARPPAGSYGPWCKCRTCSIWVIWDGPRCPCCARTLSRRTRVAVVAARQRLKARRVAAPP